MATESSTRKSKTILLDLRATDGAEDRLLWIAFVSQMASYCPVPVLLNVVGCEPAEQDFDARSSVDVRFLSQFELPESAPFAYLSGSQALGRKLLAWSDFLVVRPSGLPLRVDTHFYFREVATGRFQRLLDELGIHLGFAANMRPTKRSVSLGSSIFRADEFLDGFLENCRGLRGYSEAEHFLARAASPGNEHNALVHHVDHHPSAVYINLSQDPGLYEVWNLCARLSSAPLLSNANVDDRRSPDQLQALLSVLQKTPDVDVASTAMRVTSTRNQHWQDSWEKQLLFAGRNDPKGRYTAKALFKETASGVAARDIPHCMPVWRKRLHGNFGWFDEAFAGPSADWDFWLRAGSGGAGFYLLPEPLGLYLKANDSYWHTTAGKQDFDARIIARYRGDSAVEQPSVETVRKELQLLCRSDAMLLALQRMVALHERADEALRQEIERHAGEWFGVDADSLEGMQADDVEALFSRAQGLHQYPHIADRWLRLAADGMEAGRERALDIFRSLLELSQHDERVGVGDAGMMKDSEKRFLEAGFQAARDMWQHFESETEELREKLAASSLERQALEKRVRKLKKQLRQAEEALASERERSQSLENDNLRLESFHARIAASLSWRLGAPFRAIANRLRVHLFRRSPVNYRLPKRKG